MVELPFVTVVIPTLNEERFILPLLESLGCLDGNRVLPSPHEIIVVDGGSTDRTLQILAELPESVGIRVIHNSGRIQAAGLNLASRIADPRAKYLIRVDAHAVYAPGFVETVARTLLETGAQSVVVPLITRPMTSSSEFTWAVTLAQRSKLGNGGSAHRLESTLAKSVDHGHHAGFDIEFFRSLGGYDETFATNEDAEYDVRVAKTGGRVWFEPRAKVWYSPRETVRALAKQYFRYGQGRASTILKHGLVPRPRQMVPVAAFFGNAVGFVGGFFWLPFLAAPAAYLCACGAAAFIEKENLKRSVRASVVAEAALALAVMHMSWALGFTCKVCKSVDTITARKH
jgi:succinoglycan biosynthesis protein ExoA|nr:glycosyltransferase family 2 protein [Neorhizobium tomejilense]